MLERSPIPRIHLFEFHDETWYPPIFRQALTEWLRVVWDYSKAADVIAPVLAEALKRSGAKNIIDLCSGSSGPMIPVQQQLAAAGVDVSVLATDKFPDVDCMAGLEQRTGGKIKGCLEPVDATNLPAVMTGFRTLWNSFHHFRPEVAREILQNAQRSHQPIAVFEFTERSLLKTLVCFPASFLSVYPLIFRMRPFRTGWWFFTWILPVIPFTIGWDGLISHLRSYTKTELLAIVDDQGFSWETGKVKAPRAGLEVSYLIGLPARNAFHDIGSPGNASGRSD